MASFREGDRFKPRLDFSILQNSSVVLYWKPEILADEVRALSNLSYKIYAFDCRQWVSEDAMHADIQQKLSFPDYYGRNVNALRDCLSDLVLPDIGGTAIVLDHFADYAKGSGMAPMHSGRTEAEVILDIFAEASRWFLLFGKRFITLVQSDDPKLRFERLGGAPTRWNDREWLDKNRGI